MRGTDTHPSERGPWAMDGNVLRVVITTVRLVAWRRRPYWNQTAGSKKETLSVVHASSPFLPPSFFPFAIFFSIRFFLFLLFGYLNLTNPVDCG